MAITLYKDKRYFACVLKDRSLVIQNTEINKGVRIEHPLCEEWVDSIVSAIDDTEKREIMLFLITLGL